MTEKSFLRGRHCSQLDMGGEVGISNTEPTSWKAEARRMTSEKQIKVEDSVAILSDSSETTSWDYTSHFGDSWEGGPEKDSGQWGEGMHKRVKQRGEKED